MVFTRDLLKAIMLTRYVRINGDSSLVEMFVAKVGTDIDTTVERIEILLGIFPDPIMINIELLGSKYDVQEKYLQRYRRKLSSSAYTSRSDGTIYISAQDISRRILVHELAHAILNLYFVKNLVPIELHEIIAQYVESRVK